MSTNQGGLPVLDKLVHEPARLAILSMLRGVAQVDFNYLLGTLGLSRGNLSSHMARLCEAGYVEVSKRFVGNVPNTSYSLTALGKSALESYWRQLDALRPVPTGRPVASSRAQAVRRESLTSTGHQVLRQS